jgi:secreted trypsin-like serine protease
MAPQLIGWRALLPVLGLGVCVAGTTAARSQDVVAENGLMFVKRLDTRLNPTPPRGGEEDAANAAADLPPPPAPKGFYETELNLRSLSGAAGTRGEGGSRIIKGVPSKEGYWKSAVNIEIGRGGPNAASCGASVIERRWLLTAAHCVFDERRGGVRAVEWITAYEGSNQYKRGKSLRVAEVHVHRQYKVVNDQLTNDLALLKLERDAEAPRQKLASYHGVGAFLSEGNTATVVGWGNTETQGYKPSPILLQANVPIVGQKACLSIYPNVGQVAFCAGYPQGGVDTCQGDSGGPLFVAGSNAEPVQAGITSFGKGCAQPNAYGVYTNLGLYEQWIKELVPNAYFVAPPSGQTGTPLAQIAGVTPGGPPSPHGQVSVDIKHVPCPNAQTVAVSNNDVNRIKVGSCIRVAVTSGVTGHLRVVSRNAQGKVDTIFPNEHSGSSMEGATEGRVMAGRTLSFPGGGDSFYFKVSAPLGPAHIIAIVASEEVGLAAASKTRPGAGRTSEELSDELTEIARQINVHPLAGRAVGTRQYEVVE